MTLKKARELLALHSETLKGKDNADLRDAVHLHMEAIKRIESYRQLHGGIDFMLLPGETKTDTPL